VHNVTALLVLAILYASLLSLQPCSAAGVSGVRQTQPAVGNPVLLRGEVDHFGANPEPDTAGSKKISRDGDGYPFIVRPVLPPNGATGNHSNSNVDNKQEKPPSPLDALTLKQRLELLADRDVIVMIDQSGSMATQDCPDGLSRWQWCAKQTGDLTSSTADVLKQGITVVTFSDDFKLYPGTVFDTISKIFQTNSPQGGTHIELAMGSVLDDYFRRRNAAHGSVKPLAIAVITDGEPSELEQLREEIIQATLQMGKPDEIAISFIKVGKGEEGNAVLSHLDNDLPALGAKYDIVDAKTFDDVQKEGLLAAMTDAIVELNHPELAARPPANQQPPQQDRSTESSRATEPAKPARPASRPALARRPQISAPNRSNPLTVKQYDPSWSPTPAASWSTQGSGWASPSYPTGWSSDFDRLRQSEEEGEAIRQRLLNQN